MNNYPTFEGRDPKLYIQYWAKEYYLAIDHIKLYNDTIEIKFGTFQVLSLEMLQSLDAVVKPYGYRIATLLASSGCRMFLSLAPIYEPIIL